MLVRTPTGVPLQTVSFLLPKRNESGKVWVQVFYDLDTLLCAKFGGWTRESVTGGWVGDDGQMHVEDNYRYSVLVPDDRTAMRVAKIALAVGVLMKQKVVAVTLYGTTKLYHVAKAG